MFKILVPVDFNKTSFNAFRYASMLAELHGDAEITLLHVISGSFNTHESLSFEPMKSMEDIAVDRLEYFSEKFAHDEQLKLPEVSLKKAVRFGIPSFTIVDMAEMQNFDLIVMGTRDHHGIFDKILGSTSGIAIRQTVVPILLIHKSTLIQIPIKMAFGFNTDTELESALQSLRHYRKIVNVPIHFIHVSKEENENLAPRQIEILQSMNDDPPSSYSFEIKTIDGEDVNDTIKHYCEEHVIETLVLVHRDEHFFKDMFRKHHSVLLGQNLHIPVLVIPERQKSMATSS